MARNLQELTVSLRVRFHSGENCLLTSNSAEATTAASTSGIVVVSLYIMCRFHTNKAIITRTFNKAIITRTFSKAIITRTLSASNVLHIDHHVGQVLKTTA